MLDIKNKKRESNRAVLFLEGAKRILSQICDNELVNVSSKHMAVPNQYREGLAMISERLNILKETDHINLVRLHNHQKIQVVNYFCALGKLRALYKIQQHNNRGMESIKDLFADQIKRLQLKLE
jgi:hypothetical protein